MQPWYWLLLFLLSTVLVGVLGPALFGKEASSASFTLRLDIPSEIRAGEPLLLRMAYKNLSYRPVQLTLGGRPAYDFIVTTPEGADVWRWTHGAKILQLLEVKLLRPKGELQFTAEWNLVDHNGVLVAPGIYLVRGRLRLEPPQQIETEPKQLVISPYTIQGQHDSGSGLPLHNRNALAIVGKKCEERGELMARPLRRRMSGSDLAICVLRLAIRSDRK